MRLWYTPDPVRYFLLPPLTEPPEGGTLIRSPRGEELQVDGDWLESFAISAEEGHAALEAAAKDGVMQLGTAMRQMYEVARQATIAQTGEDMTAAWREAKSDTTAALQEAAAEAEAPMAELSQTLQDETNVLFDALKGLGAELFASLDAPETRAALRNLGASLQQHLGEE